VGWLPGGPYHADRIGLQCWSPWFYSVLRLLLDVADVRLRVRDPKAELLLLGHQLRVVRRQVKPPQLDLAVWAIMTALSRRFSRAAWVRILSSHLERTG
jgi:hypothetical protein